ncbi:MAG: hypothetical protein COS84_08465 [Armatimonadetes bacterium CG07_land_8_20_14_0_80_40_9]|nr:MAG: hypothetical protein COS84_08465 [Armatimonadetes bacterium CG07_land_8_20_14_0_80_40_9]
MKKRLITYLSYLSLLSYALSTTLVGPALSEIQNCFQVRESELGLLFAFQSIGFVSFVLLGGYLIDRYNIKLVNVLGQLDLSLGLLILSKAEAFSTAIFGFCLVGISGALIEVSTNTTISYLYQDKRASSLNLLHVYFGPGALIGPLFSAFLLNTGLKWQSVYLYAFILSGITLGLFLIQRFPERVEVDKVDFSLFFKILKSRWTILLGIAIACYVGAEMGTNNWVILYMERELSAKKLSASFFLTNFWLAMTVGRVLCVFLGKKIKEENLLFSLSISSVIFYVLFLFSFKLLSSGLFLILLGFSFSGIFATIIALGASRFPQALGTINGIIMTAVGIGFMLFPWLIGVLSTFSSLRGGMFLILFLLVMLSATSYRLIRS